MKEVLENYMDSYHGKKSNKEGEGSGKAPAKGKK